jgi:nucleotide-binding universal stress UspA family protein
MKTTETTQLGFKRALVPLDGSLVAEAILPEFLRLAHPLGMDVALIRVVVPAAIKSVATEEVQAVSGNAAPTMERMLDEADRYLRSVAALPVFEGLKVMTTVRTGEPPDEIIASAREISADVIAMTTHGRTGLKRLLFGSVAEAVLRMADVPVFMLRAAHLEAAVRVA